MKQITLSLRTESDEAARGTAASLAAKAAKAEGGGTFIMKEQQQIRVGADFFTRAVFNNAFIILELQEQCL